MQNFFELLGITDQEALKRLLPQACMVTLKRGSLLMEIGELPSQLSFVYSGILRGFVMDHSGRDITDCFVWRQGDAAAGSFGSPSPVSIEALTDCCLVQVPAALVDELLAHCPQVLQVYNRILNDALQRHWEAKLHMHHQAMQRYQWFLDAYPGLIDQVSNKYIASFLGMTPVTLSRLRHQLRENAPEAQGGGEVLSPDA